MASSYRRLVIKPPDLDDSARARLATLLSNAVAFQNRIAADSPHILRLYGVLNEDERAFHIEHEPADPIAIEQLYVPEASGVGPDDFLAAGWGVIDALRAAHGASGGGSAGVHGGINPGVLLKSPDGIWKLTDFLFAPAVCEALGPTAYLNLAVRAQPGANSQPPATGAWEVLSDAEYERDDRICGFVDPEKYAASMDHGERMLATFETGSDVVAAGILIALLAQHVHPFLSDYPEAHRIVDMSRMMASALAAPLKRTDLIGSSAPGIQPLCQMLDRMLARLPKDRPRIEEAAETLKPFAPKIDVEAIAKKQDEIAAKRWMEAIEQHLGAKQWTDLERGLNSPPPVKALPDSITKRVAEIRKKLDEFSASEKRHAAIEADRKSANAWFKPFAEAVKSQSWVEARDLARKKPSLTYWPADVERALEPLEKALAVEIKRLDDEELARKWLTSIEGAIAQNNWFEAEKRLGDKPSVDHWPREVVEEVRRHERDIRDKLKVIRGEHDQARRWLEEAAQAARIKAFGRALEILNNRPHLEHWPEGLIEQSDRLFEECTARIGEDVMIQLQTHLDAVERAARMFLKGALDSDFPGLIDVSAIKIVIDSDQMKSEDSMDRGTAEMVLSFIPVSDKAPSPEARLPFDYDLARKDTAVLDADGTLRKSVADALRATLKARQSQGPVDLIGQLKKNLFPDVVAKLTAGATAREARLIIDLKPGVGKSFEAMLQWDARELAWSLQSPAALLDQIMDRVVAIARATVLLTATKDAPVIQPYSKYLDAEISIGKVDASPLPKLVAFTGRLFLKHPKDGRTVDLQSLKGEFASSDRVELFARWTQAESAFVDLLTSAQNDARQTLIDETTARSAGGKAKVTANPKRIKEPTSEITLEIKAKGEANQSLTARWNPDKFVYELSSAATSAVPEKKPKSPVPDARAPIAAKAVYRSENDAGATPPTPASNAPDNDTPPSPARSGSKRRLALIGGGLLAVVALVAVIALTRSNTKVVQNSNDATVAVAEMPAPPSSLEVNISTLLAAVNPEFSNSFARASELVDGSPPGLTTVQFDNPWQAGSGEFKISVGNAQIGPDPVQVECTIQYDSDTRAWSPASWAPRSPRLPNDLADWMRRRALRKLSSLQDGKKSDEAANLHRELSPIFIAWQREGFTDALPDLKETIAKVERKPPGLPEDVELSDLFSESNPQFATAAGAMLKHLKDPERRRVKHGLNNVQWDLSKPDRSSAQGEFKLWDGTDFEVTCEVSYDAEKDAHVGQPRWKVDEPAEELFRIASTLENESAESIRAASREGRLKEAIDFRDAIDAPLIALRNLPEFTSLPNLDVNLPPAWTADAVSGYTPSEQIDPATGYPISLSSVNDSRIMLLVAVPPADPLWAALKAPESEIGWRISYVDAREWSKDPSSPSGDPFRFDQAKLSAELAGTRLPTRLEWAMAAMKLRKNPEAAGLFDSHYEWCSDPVTTTRPDEVHEEHWITGGCEINKLLNLPARPATDADDAAWIEWLNDPVVTQVRSHDDELVGLRTELLIYPEPQ